MNGKNVSLRFLFSKKPWFVRLKEVMEERDDLKSIVSLEAQGKNMKDILDNRNQGIKMMFKRETALARQIAFRAWRNYYIDQRARRRRFRRYQLNMWLRRWKNEHFGEGGGEEAAAKSTAAGGTPADRSWQKRFRASEKENLKLQVSGGGRGGERGGEWGGGDALSEMIVQNAPYMGSERPRLRSRCPC